ncbi:MAG: MBL fold metallo-hydrolase [Candidatus Heimdallarchaeota archaeon]|nr:MBL fold metallo-hydrolase [Candidatus Heimdallarchaeota archaeon]
MSWFEIKKLNHHLYLIRERLDRIEPRYRTTYVNLYLIIGEKLALLFDTGSGVESLGKIVNSLIDKRELIVLNSHNHFDHILGNHEFEFVFIHQAETVENPIDISFLQPFSCDLYNQFEYKIPNCSDIRFLKGGEIFDLGGVELEVIHTPGHSSGSICLFSNKNELFTADTVYDGPIYLPPCNELDSYIHSLHKLQKIVESSEPVIYGGHEHYECSSSIIDELLVAIKNIEKEGEIDEFLNANIVSSGRVKIILPLD